MWCCSVAQLHKAGSSFHTTLFNKTSLVQWGQVEKKTGSSGVSYGHIIKWKPHSPSAAFQECLKQVITGFQPSMKPLRLSHLPKGTLSVVCLKLSRCWHHPTFRTAEVNGTLNWSPPKKRRNKGAPAPMWCAAPLPECKTTGTPLRSPSLPACQGAPCAHLHVNAPLYFQTHTWTSTCTFSSTHAHTHAESNSHVLFHPPAFPLTSLRASAPLSLQCSAALAHVSSCYSPVLTTRSCSLSPNAQSCNPAVISLVHSCACVSSHAHLQSSGPEQDQHVSGSEINMLVTSLFSKPTLW